MATHLSLEVDFIPGFIELVALHKNGHDVLGWGTVVPQVFLLCAWILSQELSKHSEKRLEVKSYALLSNDAFLYISECILWIKHVE